MDELYFEDDNKESLDEELRDETEEAERSSEIDSSEQAEIPGSENIVEEFNNTNLEEVHEIEDVESRDNRSVASYSTESKAERFSAAPSTLEPILLMVCCVLATASLALMASLLELSWLMSPTSF